MFSFTLDIYCTSVRPGRGIPHMWLSLRFLLSFYLLKGFFSSFSLLLLRVKGRGCHTLLKPYETNCGLWIWAIQIKFDWLIDWYAAATANDKGRLQRIIRSAEKVIGCNLPSLQDLFASRTLRRAGKIVADPSHPGHTLFKALPSGRRLRSIRTKTSRHNTSFFPAAVGLINMAWDPHLTWTPILTLHYITILLQ